MYHAHNEKLKKTNNGRKRIALSRKNQNTGNQVYVHSKESSGISVIDIQILSWL